MGLNIVESFNKEDIQTLPVEQFEGHIYVINNELETRKAVDYLIKKKLLGFDTETRPSFKKGKVNLVALLQVATQDQCFLFRLNKMNGIPDPLIQLLEDTSITKIGLGLKDDIQNLKKRTIFETGTFIDIQNEVAKIGIKDKSLQKIYANLFGKKIVKRQQLSNWEAEVLTPAQQLYAATDAWACINIYNEIQHILNETNIS